MTLIDLAQTPPDALVRRIEDTIYLHKQFLFRSFRGADFLFFEENAKMGLRFCHFHELPMKEPRVFQKILRKIPNRGSVFAEFVSYI